MMKMKKRMSVLIITVGLLVLASSLPAQEIRPGVVDHQG